MRDASSRAEWLDIEHLGQTDRAAWRELADHAVEPNPFFDPDFVVAAHRCLNEPRVGLLVVRDRGGRWLGAMPVRNLRGWHGYPLGACVSWRHLYSFFGAPLLRSEPMARESLGRLLAGAAAESPVVGLDLLPASGPLAEMLEQVVGSTASPVVFDRYERAALARRHHKDYVDVSSKHQRDRARLRRRLSEEVGAELEVTDRSSDPRAYEDFVRIERSGWKGRQGTALGAKEGHDTLFVEICEAFAARGQLQLLALHAGERMIAMKCNLIAGGVAFAFKIGHDADLARFSPGIQLELAFVDEFHRRKDLRLADSCAEASNAMINRLWPDRRHLENVALTRPGPRGAGRRSALNGVSIARKRRNRK